MNAEWRTMEPGTARKPRFAKLRFVPACEFGIDLVPPIAGMAFDQAHVVQAERQQHRFLQPLVHDPFAADLLGHARASGIEIGKCLVRQPRARRPRVCGVQRIARFPGAFDDAGDAHVQIRDAVEGTRPGPASHGRYGAIRQWDVRALASTTPIRC